MLFLCVFEGMNFRSLEWPLIVPKVEIQKNTKRLWRSLEQAINGVERYVFMIYVHFPELISLLLFERLNMSLT